MLSLNPAANGARWISNSQGPLSDIEVTVFLFRCVSSSCQFLHVACKARGPKDDHAEAIA